MPPNYTTVSRSGDKSSSTFYKVNAIMQPMPDLKYSPYLTLGVGKIEVDPNATLISPETDSDMAQFGIGVQRYISRSFLFRSRSTNTLYFRPVRPAMTTRK